MRRGTAFGRVCRCLSVCLSCLCSNFWKPWPRNFILGMRVAYIFRISGSSSYVRIIWSVSGQREQRDHTHVTKYTQSRVLRIWLKGWLVFLTNAVVRCEIKIKLFRNHFSLHRRQSEIILSQRGKLAWNYFKIISEDYCSSWIFSSVFNIAGIILK